MAPGAVTTAARNADLVLHIRYSVHLFSGILGHSLGVTVIDRARQCHLALFDFHFDVGGVDVWVSRELFVDVFLDAIVGTLPTFRASPLVRSRLARGV